jgi:hypothetical protein
MDALQSLHHLVATEHPATGNNAHRSMAYPPQVIGNAKGHLTTTAISKQHQFMARCIAQFAKTQGNLEG